jgi:hypothetical protein
MLFQAKANPFIPHVDLANDQPSGACRQCPRLGRVVEDASLETHLQATVAGRLTLLQLTRRKGYKVTGISGAA